MLNNGTVFVSPSRLEIHKSLKESVAEHRNHQLDSVTNDDAKEQKHTRQYIVTNDVSGEEHLNRH